MPERQFAKSHHSSSQIVSTWKGEQILVTICAVMIQPHEDRINSVSACLDPGALKPGKADATSPLCRSSMHLTLNLAPELPPRRGGAPSGDLRPGPQGEHCVTQTCVIQKETRGHFLGQCNFSSLPHCSCPLKPLAFIGPHLVLFPPHIHAPTHL